VELDGSIEKFIEKYGLAFGAFISCFAALMVDQELHQSLSLLMWLFIRAVRNLTPSHPYSSLVSVIVMMIAGAQNLPNWIFNPHLLHPSYKRFLDVHGGLEPFRYLNLRYNPLKSACSEIHPGGETAYHCAKYTVTHFTHEFFQASKLYIPLHVFSFLLSERKNVLSLLKNIIQSTVFLSSFTTLAWSSSCIYYRIWPGLSINSLRGHTWITGLSTLIERPSRRPELAAYCLTYALEVFYNQLVEWKYIDIYPKLNLLLISFFISILIYHHDQQPNIIMKFLLNILKKKERRSKRKN